MYSYGVSARRQFFNGNVSSQTNSSNVSGTDFAGMLAASIKNAHAAASDADCDNKPAGANRICVDDAIRQDIREVFGIEPHKAGESLKGIGESLWALDSDGSGMITYSTIAANVELASAIFQDHFSRFMLRENVSTRPPIELTMSKDGMARVNDDHPDKEKIENFINSNAEVRNLYAGICSTKNFLALAEESIAFQKRYAVDPQAAVCEFAHLFSDKYGYNTSLTIGPDSWNYQTTASFGV
jgi:hypothetical protein